MNTKERLENVESRLRRGHAVLYCWELQSQLVLLDFVYIFLQATIDMGISIKAILCVYKYVHFSCKMIMLYLIKARSKAYHRLANTQIDACR